MQQQSQIDYTVLPGSLVTAKGEQGAITAPEINSKILKEIDAPDQKIKFYVSRNRIDIPECSTLDSLTVEDNNGNIKKRFGLSHSYFGNTLSNNSKDVRLKLDSVSEFSCTNSDKKKYSLDYYNPAQVPPIDSKSQDYWGYYNGAGNSTLLPAVSPLDYPQLAAPLAGANRSVNFNDAVIGVLKILTYPTGGTSTFIYEGNDYGASQAGNVNEGITTINGGAGATAILSTSPLINTPTKTATFTIPAITEVQVIVKGSYTGLVPVDNGPTVMLNKVNADNSRTNILQYFGINQITTKFITLNSGNYEVIASVDGTGQMATIDVGYNAGSDTAIKTLPCGGVRIKQIINTDLLSSQLHTINYTYKTNDLARSSGELFSAPALIDEENGYLVRTSSTANYLSGTQGSCVGYSQVTEFESSGNISNGKTISYFNAYPQNLDGARGQTDTSFIISNDGQTQAMFFVPAADPKKLMTDYDVYRGNLLKEDVFNANGNLAKETLYTYNLDSAILSTSPNYYELSTRRGSMFEWYTLASTSDPERTYTFTVAKILCPWIYKMGEIERTYAANGIDYIERSENLFYENLIHAQVTKTQSINSKGDTLTTLYKYPQDITAGLSSTAEQAREGLISSHNLSPILELDNYKNGIKLTTAHTFYRNWSPTIILPEFVQEQKGTAIPDPKIQFYNYDSVGNILEESRANDLHQVFIWGYNNSYPVAKIIGSNYATAIQYINNSILQNPASDDQLRTELNKLRLNLPKAFITTYTYAPLVGVTSESDPNNRITYYQYDGLNRLELIKDQDGNIVKKFDYKYAGQ